MMHSLLRTITTATALSILFVSQMDAYCSRCVKIETERAKEQATHPQPVGYYDDQKESLKKDDVPTDSHQSDSKILKPSYSDVKSSNLATLLQTDGFKSLLADNDGAAIKEVRPSPSNTGSSEINRVTPIADQSLSKAYSVIYTVLKTKNFLETLDGSFTLFIPTNKALQALSPQTIIGLTQAENAEQLATLVSNHVVSQKILRKDFIDNNETEIKAISGRNLTLSYKEGNLYIENVKILRVEPAGHNGVIYVIDQVLTP